MNNKEEAFKLAEEGEILTDLYSWINSIKSIKSIKEAKKVRPVTLLPQISLFTGAFQEPNMMSEIKREIVTNGQITSLNRLD